MAKTQSAMTMRDALYEAPGPRTRRKMVVGTVISLAAVVPIAARYGCALLDRKASCRERVSSPV